MSTRWRSARTGETLAAGTDDGKVWLWNLTDPARPARLGQPLTGPDGSVNSVAFSPDGKTLAAGSADGKVWLWNLTDPARPARLGQPLTGPGGSVVSVAFSPDGKTLAAGSGDGKVWLWNLTDPARPARLGQPLTGPTARRLGGVQPGRADPGRRQPRTTPSGCGISQSNVLTGPATAVSTRWRSARTGGSWPPAAATARSGCGTWPTRPAPPARPAADRPRDIVNSVAFSPDGRTLAVGSADGKVWLWNLADPARPARLGQPLTGPAACRLGGVQPGRARPWPPATATARSGCGTSPTRPAPPGSASH